MTLDSQPARQNPEKLPGNMIGKNHASCRTKHSWNSSASSTHPGTQAPGCMINTGKSITLLSCWHQLFEPCRLDESSWLSIWVQERVI